MTGMSLKQNRFLARERRRVEILEGSVRSGKTHVSIPDWLETVASAPKRGALLMSGKSRDALYRNVFEPIENEPELSAFAPFVEYRQGAPTARILGRLVHVVGANDAKAEAKIRGMTVAAAYVDELSTVPEEFFRQLLARASVPGATIVATTNPDSPQHWLKVNYLDKLGELPDWRSWHFTMDDNPGLERAYVESLKREYSGVWYKRFILGLWVAAEGAVYDTFDSDVHVLTAEQLPNIDSVLAVGLDYGTTHRTRAYLIGMGEGPHGPALYVLGEFAPGTATVGQHAAMFRSWLSELEPASFREPRWIAVDPAAAVMRQQLFDDGMKGVVPAHNSVLPGIQVVSSLFASSKLYVLDTCTELVKALPGYRWDSAAAARGVTRPIKENDDEVDALRYAIFTSRRLWRSRIPLRAADTDETMEHDDTPDG